jgi:hypothetical protein
MIGSTIKEDNSRSRVSVLRNVKLSSSVGFGIFVWFVPVTTIPQPSNAPTDFLCRFLLKFYVLAVPHKMVSLKRAHDVDFSLSVELLERTLASMLLKAITVHP